MGFRPFADEAVALRIGGLTAENLLDRVSLWGNLDLTRDRAGLQRARELRALLDAVVAALEGEALPERGAPSEPPSTVKNPFG